MWAIASGCEGANSGLTSGSDSDSDGDSDGDTDSDGDSDTDGDTDLGYVGDLIGTVRSATGFPISGALVYVTNGDGADIPDNVYCYTCDDMTTKKWTLSNADGTWSIDQVPAGDRNLVTRKGFFQRQRAITVSQDVVNDIPVDKTTLPGANTGDGLDQIPNYAVLLNWYDRPEDMLSKMGLADLSPAGEVVSGTENFHMYNDDESYPSAIGQSSSLFSQGQDWINQYHMIFFPCICNTLSAGPNIPMLTTYVSSGGKIYGSCWAGQWVEQPFPNVIEFNGSDTVYNPGDIGLWNSFGTINDPEMRAWLAVVQPSQNLDHYPFDGGWILIDSLNDTAYDGHGVLADGTIGGPVVTTNWVTDVANNNSHPLTITYPYDCGKIFYSTYQVVENNPSLDIRPQEAVLIYLFYEVGVCEGEYVPPE